MESLVKFSVRNLDCSYNKRHVVLHIDQLDVCQGQVIFIVGPSGIGKSTLLETLGLMNNTIHNPVEATAHFNATETEAIDLSTIWGQSDNYRAHLRAKHMSFIFQETNLMPGLSAGENLSMKMLIQGASLGDARRVAYQYMPRLGLSEDLFDRRIQELSGGQRQRLAFLRAFLGESGILFGDEPTGNLDRMTANKLMSLVQSSVKEGSKSAAIIVSHDFGLAASYADLIVPIVPRRQEGNDETVTGYIGQDMVLTRLSDTTFTVRDARIDDVELYLHGLLAMA